MLKETIFCGMSRSGNHAIINWVARNAVGQYVYHCNNVTMKRDCAQEVEYRKGEGNPVRLYSFENRCPGDVFSGKATNKVLIIRDFFNWLASSIKAKMPTDAPKINMYERHLEWAMNPQDGTIVANYNRWFQDREYRRQLANTLGISDEDHGLQELMDFGGGSSFDKTSYSGKTQQMNVLERYKQMKDNPEFLRIINEYQGIVRNTERFFGIAC